MRFLCYNLNATHRGVVDPESVYSRTDSDCGRVPEFFRAVFQKWRETAGVGDVISFSGLVIFAAGEESRIGQLVEVKVSEARFKAVSELHIADGPRDELDEEDEDEDERPPVRKGKGKSSIAEEEDDT